MVASGAEIFDVVHGHATMQSESYVNTANARFEGRLKCSRAREPHTP